MINLWYINIHLNYTNVKSILKKNTRTFLSEHLNYNLYENFTQNN